MKNLDLLQLVLKTVEEVTGETGLDKLITYVPDRPGHDFRYAMDDAKVQQLGYRSIWPLQAGLRETVRTFPGVPV